MSTRSVLILALIIVALITTTAPPPNTAERVFVPVRPLSLSSYVPPNETECDIIVPDNYPSIYMSVKAARPGQTICVRPGTYIEVNGIIIDKSGLRLLALGRPEIPSESVVIKRRGFLLRIQASNVIVKGFVIVQEGNWHGIDIYSNSQNVTVAYNIVTTTYSSITNYYGIRVYRAANAVIAYNKIYGWFYSYGVFINEASNNTIANNTIYNNGNGIRIRGTTNPAKYNKVFLNTIVNNTYGIYFSVAYGGVLSDNEIYLNTFNNLNNYGVYGTPGPNRWHSSIEYTYRYRGQYFTSYMGNYWSNYKGRDSDSNGIGDTPHVIGSNNVDEYPLIRPHQEYLIGMETLTPTETTETTTTEITTETATETITSPVITMTLIQPITVTTTLTQPIQTKAVTLIETESVTKTEILTSVITFEKTAIITITERQIGTVKVMETSPVETPVVDYGVTTAVGMMLLLVGFMIGFVLRRR